MWATLPSLAMQRVTLVHCNLVVEEVRQIGRLLDIPRHLVDKTPSDGLSGQSDEDKLGFTYAVLDRYIRTGEIEDIQTKERIDYLQRINRHKLELMPSFKPSTL